MSAPLSIEEVRKIAALARLKLRDDEIQAMTHQLGAVVAWVAQLSGAATDGVEPLAHPIPVQNVFREDEPAASLSPEEALANAPEKRLHAGSPFYAVPAVLE